MSNAILIGTANLSQSAWGSFQMNKRQFNVKNFELGVLFVKHPLLNNITDPNNKNTNNNNTNTDDDSNNTSTSTDEKSNDSEVDPRANERFLGTLYLPFPKTLVKYGSDDLPWVKRN